MYAKMSNFSENYFVSVWSKGKFSYIFLKNFILFIVIFSNKNFIR